MRPSHLFAALILSCATAFAIDASSPRFLFLDPAFIEQSERVALHVNPPERQEIVIRPDQPWEQLMISFFLTVRDEEGKLRLWYICRDKENQPNVAYAESRDGVTWVKPELGLVDYHGSKANNLVGMTSLEGVVFRDPNAPAAERYCYVTHLITEGMVRFHSPDGLRWSRDAAPLLRFGADTQNVTYWDELRGKYVMYLRGWLRGEKTKYRHVVRAELPNLTTPLDLDATEQSLRLWGEDKVAVIENQFPTVLATDERDPKNTDVYNISAQPYPLDPRWTVGFPSMFQRERSTSDGRLEMHFVGSTDGGSKWHRYDRAPYVRLGLADSDNCNMVYMGTGLVMRGDEIWQYGTGFRSRHGDRESRKVRADGVIYRYVQRVDGFVSLDFDNEEGRCRTAPVLVSGPRLRLNVDTAAFGSLRVSLSDADGAPIQGFTAGDCEVIRANSTGAVVTWRNDAALTALRGRMVRLGFTGSRTKLYSFRFDGGDDLSK